ncbi:MAG: DsbA family protein [Nitrospinae bacterium]|nr:DsbA family protein [Nitrospinota bacterium]
MDAPFKKETFRFYFSFNDPYSFLITPAVLGLAKDYRVDIEYLPLTQYDSAGLFSPDAAQAAYWREDIARFAKKAGRTLNFMDAPQDSSGVCRAKWLADEKMVGVKLINLVFAMRWVNGKDISSATDAAAGLAFLELDGAALADAFSGAAYQLAQDKAEDMADADGVIGVPFFVFRGQKFYGADRIEALEGTLKNDPNLIIHHDAAYSVIKPEELAARLAEGKPALVLDVRIPKDFGAGHIPGANCLPAKIVHRNLERLEREWTIIVVDDGGVDANETAFMLSSRGYRNVSVLSGGIRAWKGPLEKGLDTWHDKLKGK